MKCIKSVLPRNTLIRTPSGLTPLSKLSPGDAVIVCSPDGLQVDTIEDIKADHIADKAIKVQTTSDETIVGITPDLETAKIGAKLNVLVEDDIVDDEIKLKQQVTLDDIVFSIYTKTEHALLIGKNGSILFVGK